MHRRPLPADLPDIFDVAQARALGVTTTRLRARDLSAPFHGVRVSNGENLTETAPGSRLEARARAYAARMLEEEFFSHETAAALWGLPTRRPVDPRILHVTVPAPLRAHRSRGIRGHQVREHLVTVVESKGLRVSDPVSTWTMLAADYDETELVCLGDALIRDLPDPGVSDLVTRPRPLADRHEVLAVLEAGTRPGLPSARRAAERLSERSRSPAESRTRLLMEDARLPAPELNMDVRDGDGLFIANVDFAFPRFHVVVEYEGDHHRTDRDQFRRDIDRIEKLTAARWRVVRLVSAHVFVDPREAVRRVSEALRDRGWRG